MGTNEPKYARDSLQLRCHVANTRIYSWVGCVNGASCAIDTVLSIRNCCFSVPCTVQTTCINAATFANVCNGDCIANSFILKWSVRSWLTLGSVAHSTQHRNRVVLLHAILGGHAIIYWLRMCDFSVFGECCYQRSEYQPSLSVRLGSISDDDRRGRSNKHWRSDIYNYTVGK
jgi:hypothetical protein